MNLTDLVVIFTKICLQNARQEDQEQQMKSQM